ncbi:hypothetical protein [Streptomyces sp. NPDC096132]|uniref:hypothetical protein n=1 Tax=Streptomyces sp. NPDC096132 TaxID=3366075 RepID=UPI003813BD10
MWLGQPSGGGGGNRAKAAAVAAATTVVVTVGLTGSLLLGGEKAGVAGSTDAKASASASQSATASASGTPGGTGTAKPTVPGWKVVVNPEWGTAFDVPPDWDVKDPDLLFAFGDDKLDHDDPENWGKFLIAVGGTAVFKENWCLSDDDKDGRVDGFVRAVAGTKGEKGARNTADAVLNEVGLWIYGGYTQPDKKSITTDRTAKPYTTRSGVKGSIAWSRSGNTPRKGRCASDGKAVMFGFKNSAGEFVAWSLVADTGGQDEVPDSTIMKILSTVRLHGDPAKS